MQQQAAAAARDMQRRATLPMPPARNQELGPPHRAYGAAGTPDRRQEARSQRQEESRPQFRQPEPLHHKSPSQQARQYASYGRMQPQMRRQEWQPPKAAQKPPPRPAPPRNKEPPRRQEAPQYQEPPPPPASPMPPLADLLGMLGGLGGLGGAASPKQEAASEDVFGAFAPGEGGEGGMDSIMMLLLLFLLQKESADQGLLLALMYIMM